MEKKTKIRPGQVGFYFLTAVLFTGTFLFFSFSESEAVDKGLSQQEIDQAYLLVNERLLTPLNSPYGRYNYSNMRGGMMSRGGSSRLSQAYHFAFLLNHEPLCKPRRRNKVLCGNLEFNIFGNTPRQPLPMKVDLSNQTIHLEWENQQLTDKEWLEVWAQEVAKERKASKSRMQLEEIRLLEPKQTEKLTVPEEK